MSGVWIHTKSSQLSNRQVNLIIIADRSNKKISVLNESHGIKKRDIPLGTKQNRTTSNKSGKINSLVVKSRDKHQIFGGKEVNSRLLKEALRAESSQKCEKDNYQGDRYQEQDSGSSKSQPLSRQVKPEGTGTPQDAEGFLLDSTEVSETTHRKDQAALSDNSGGDDASNLLNSNQSPVFSYQVPLTPEGHYVEYSGKLTRRDTTYFRGKGGSIFEQPGQCMKPHETGPKSLLKTNAVCLIGVIIAILLMLMFMVLR